MRLPVICLLLFVSQFLACSLLDPDPQDKISTDQAFTNESSAQNAVNGLYNEVQSIYDWRVQAISDLSSDIAQSIDTWDAFISLDEYRTTRDNSEVEDLYTVLYRAIDIANNIIVEVPKLRLPTERENNLVGQALCIRAMMYFELARFWGGVPNVYGQWGVVIRTEPSKGINEESFGSRATLMATYQRVQQDFEKALELLPETRGNAISDRSHTVKATARAFLSRLHLYLKNYTQAEQYATQVISDTRYALEKPYAAIFRSKNTAESVLEMQYSTTDISGLRNWYYPASLGGRGGLALHDAFYQELTANALDERGKLVALNVNAGVYYPTKYDLAGNASNTHVIRLAELYLNRAESRAQLANLTGAQADLNAVRNRAGLANTTADTQETLMEAILQERKLEFYQEGHRWFDLLRTGKAVEVLKNMKRKTGSQLVSLGDIDRQVLPFPTSEILTNPNLVQNEAYK